MGGDGVHIEADQIILLGGGQVLVAVGDLQPGVVQHDIHRHFQCINLCQHIVHSGKIVQFAGHTMSLYAHCFRLSLHLLGAFQGAAVENQVAALLGHEDSGQVTNAAAGAGDQRPFAFHIDHKGFLLAF